MTLDHSVIGTRLPAHTVDVERGRLRSFARATGQTDPVHVDVEAARAAGHPDLLVPPTFLVCLDREQPDPTALYDRLGIDQRTVLHGEQGFAYHAPAYAGDRITFTGEVTDLIDKKGGAMQLLMRTVEARRDGELVAVLTGTTVIRHKHSAPGPSEPVRADRKDER
ncbi:MaoC family dehydratase N-terminal domain-containing protein [Streptomyces uncialis]|uniref:MaoC family dehydratase N-terminal domain-containing protein n=1 Tax=Streptomyces uncialis TaxID=1048205 RepID=UPI003830B657